jgi:hypothetical protein
MTEPLTTDEFTVAHDLYLARMAGLAGAIEPEYLPAAHDLAEKKWLERRWHDGDMVWWFTDKGLTGLELSALSRTEPADWN